VSCRQAAGSLPSQDSDNGDAQLGLSPADLFIEYKVMCDSITTSKFHYHKDVICSGLLHPSTYP
jgi:hypothetical protein